MHLSVSFQARDSGSRGGANFSPKSCRKQAWTTKCLAPSQEFLGGPTCKKFTIAVAAPPTLVVWGWVLDQVCCNSLPDQLARSEWRRAGRFVERFVLSKFLSVKGVCSGLLTFSLLQKYEVLVPKQKFDAFKTPSELNFVQKSLNFVQKSLNFVQKSLKFFSKIIKFRSKIIKFRSKIIKFRSKIIKFRSKII